MCTERRQSPLHTDLTPLACLAPTAAFFPADLTPRPPLPSSRLGRGGGELLDHAPPSTELSARERGAGGVRSARLVTDSRGAIMVAAVFMSAFLCGTLW